MTTNQCKLTTKCHVRDNPTTLFNCWNPECDKFMHLECSTLLLDNFSIKKEERPTAEDVQEHDEEEIVFCKKGCFTKWRTTKNKAVRAATAAAKETFERQRKARVPWEDDGTLPILLDWITTEGNYAKFCGSLSNNKGKRKKDYYKKIAELIKLQKPESDRNEKDVENKIGKLERQFRDAYDWSLATGVGVKEDNETNFWAYMKQLCSLWDELEPIMGSRPNAKPIATSESMPLCFSDSSDSEGENEVAIRMSNNNKPDSADNNKPDSANNRPNSTPATTSNKSKKRLTSGEKSGDDKRSKKTDADSVISSLLDDQNFNELRLREVEAKEKEASARMIEAEAISKKNEEEAELISIQKRATLLRERTQLKNSGCPQEDIDILLPLK